MNVLLTGRELTRGLWSALADALDSMNLPASRETYRLFAADHRPDVLITLNDGDEVTVEQAEAYAHAILEAVRDAPAGVDATSTAWTTQHRPGR